MITTKKTDMSALYPMKFSPIFKDKIWGGNKIREVLGKDFSPLPNCGEMWAISGVQGNETVVENGFLAGNELNELVEIYMDELVGEACFGRHGNEFPLLIKFIDAREWLSIQVHPDDQLARKRKIGNGKTEMWYILEADEGSRLISGFSQTLNQNTYLRHLEDKTLKDIMNYESVKTGDVFFMPAGRVHALGPGILLAEIQQTSDTTYRIYDWDRVDSEGKSRELHTRDALEAIDFEVKDTYRTDYRRQYNETENLVTCPYFTTNLLDLTRAMRKNFEELDSFIIYLCVEGRCSIKSGDHEVIEMLPGDSVLLPAVTESVEYHPSPDCKLLEVYI